MVRWHTHLLFFFAFFMLISIHFLFASSSSYSSLISLRLCALSPAAVSLTTRWAPAKMGKKKLLSISFFPQLPPVLLFNFRFDLISSQLWRNLGSLCTMCSTRSPAPTHRSALWTRTRRSLISKLLVEKSMKKEQKKIYPKTQKKKTFSKRLPPYSNGTWRAQCSPGRPLSMCLRLSVSWRLSSSAIWCVSVCFFLHFLFVGGWWSVSGRTSRDADTLMPFPLEDAGGGSDQLGWKF